ncbi:MAG: nucleotidyltransferase domain-containing protein [Methylicorpusculum sp.]|uniref:type VII toxin-antitoxin system MntA family adenylyltransferase antitoxin n=1 Tax=Methylicorpusculum sp. TaxID=2713644 RepID=UPI00271A5649|nr:nucleotidyltransferase domain-containing protein [Methylicorpusculum sp.]MDO8938771.1 nucleotidyltransferase domain-containing protein [Methylicorpusculum sp.]MDP2201244.1 nucleotidyltransferase domain-containing protein [Methylicorpusculum sp.]
MPTIEDATEPLSRIEASVQKVLTNFGGITLAILFGSVVTGRQRTDSDLDIAVAMQHPLSADEKMALIQALAEVTGRPVDLIDLTTAPEPLLGQIVLHGRRILGNDTLFGNLISRHLIEQADFMPYRNRILSERRKAWLGK